MARRNIAEVNGLHQSLWLDNLSRRLIRSGDLARLRDLGVTGITSNPTIFQKAVAQGAGYDTESAGWQGSVAVRNRRSGTWP